MTWQDLEKKVKKILAKDNPKIPANSGGTKREEDVVGRTILAQCKYTSQINSSILKKDLQRLLKNAKVLDKFPVFVNGNNEDLLISIPWIDTTEEDLELALALIIMNRNIKKAQMYLPYIQSTKDLEKLDNIIATCRSIYKQLTGKTHAILRELKDFVDRKYLQLSTYDLFDGGKR